MKPLAVFAGLAVAASAFASSAQPADAGYDDVGLLADVAEIRSEFEHDKRAAGADLMQVVVRGDWAHLTVGSKGAYFLTCHRHGRTWCRSYAPQADAGYHPEPAIPRDVTAFFDLIDRETGRAPQ